MVPIIIATIFLLAILIAVAGGPLICAAAAKQPGGHRGVAGGGARRAWRARRAPGALARATPIKVLALHPRDRKWYFNKPIPENLKTLPERIWFVKSTIRSKTKFSDETTPIANPVIPEGFRIWKPPAAANAFLSGARSEIGALFARETRAAPDERLPCSDQRNSRGLYYLFTRPPGLPLVYYKEAMATLQEAAPVLAKFCHEYFLHLAQIYQLSPESIVNKVQLILLRYDPMMGIWLHIDNVARYDRGPIATISLGPPDVTYDLAPTLAKAGAPIRVLIREGDFVIMDGRSRMEWSHGIPYGLDAYKYTVMFKCDHFTDHIVGYQPTLQTNIYEAIPGKGGLKERGLADDGEGMPRKGDILGGFAG